MKQLLTLVCVSCLNSAALYPLLMSGSTRGVSPLIESALVFGGCGALFLLVKYRRSL